VIAVVTNKPLRQVDFRHEQAGRIEVADIERDQRTTVIILGNIEDRGSATEAVHHAETDRILIKHWLEHAAHGALLAPYFAADGLRFQKSRR
jgi:hypothetical protein